MDLDWIASVCGAKQARRVERVQSLWSGYGEIVRVALDDVKEWRALYPVACADFQRLLAGWRLTARA